MAASHLEPAMKAFEALHSNYLESFRSYEDALLAPALLNAQHPLLEAIPRDNLFSEDLRARVRVLSRYRDDPVLGPFVGSMIHYLQGFSEESRRLRQSNYHSQIWRTRYVTSIVELAASPGSDQDKKVEARELLRDIVAQLQGHFENVVSAYTTARDQLLRAPRHS
jgi:hypothetical protein